MGRPHGLDGSFYVTGARPRLLDAGMTITIADRSRTIVRRAGTEERPIVRVEGIEDRTAAQAVRGLALTVQRSHAPSLDEGEWWASDLEGCVVVDGERRIGVVRRLLELPSCEALEIDPLAPDDAAGQGGAARRAARAGPLLVPMVRDAIRRVDVAAGRIDVDMSFVEVD